VGRPFTPLDGEPSHRFFPEGGKKIIPEGRKGLESKTQDGTPRGSGIGIERSSVHTYPHLSHAKNFPLESWVKIPVPKIFHQGIASKNFPHHKSFQKISPSRVWAKISGYRNWQKIP
jgi:hypothetical protein